MSALVEVRGVTKQWGDVVALQGADAVIEPGITGLLGSNGAGKTTLLGMMLGLHQPTAGDISVLGLDPRNAGPEVRALIGYAPEHHDLPPDIAAFDFVRHMAEVHGLPYNEANTRSNDALWQVGLGEERLRPIGTMSTGQRQRVKLAQAFVHDPQLVLLDEPTDGLDPVQRDDVLNLISKLGNEHGINIVLSSHLLEEVERVCERVVILNGGRVIASGPINSLGVDAEGFVVTTDDQVADVKARLSAGGATVDQGETNSLVVTHAALDDDALLDLIRDCVVDSGASLRSLVERRTSLEDVFLAVGT